MKNWELEIARAKKEVLNHRIAAWEDAWREKWYKDHRKEKEAYAPEPPRPPKEVTEVKAWFIAQWDTGFIVCDMQELMKKPKRQRDKILALGGLA